MGYVLPEDPAEREAFLAANRAAFEASRRRKGLPTFMPTDILERAADYLSSSDAWKTARRAS